MEDYKFLIYLALSILWFLFRNKKKKPKNQRPNPQQGREEQSSQEKRPKTFEEILQELSGGSSEKSESPQPVPEKRPETSYEFDQEVRSYDDQVEEGIPMDNSYMDDTLKDLYKKGEQLKSIDELVDIEKVETSSRFKSFEEEEEDNSFATDIKRSLSEPESAKKAIILSEILNRKY